MSKLAFLGLAALLSAATATPVAAQEVVSNPGRCAQYYPDANCQNNGANNPLTGDYQLRNEIRGAYASGVSPCALGADYYVGRGGRRYACY